MTNIWTIFRRELSAYFYSLIGYMFIIVFLLVGVGLFMTPFFTFPEADMRSFFNLLPLLLCIFIPAVTMRLWADERKENTFEMIMTFPMKTWQVVLGKYFSALAFYLIALAGTLVIPVMLLSLGRPDLGQIASAYFGSILLGGMFLAIGLFVSVLCTDQIVAFVATLLVNIVLYLMGMDFIQSYLEGAIPGLGGLLGDLLGFIGHFNPFARGVIEVTDILFFASWIVLFLFLNGFYLELRSRPEMKWSLTTGVVLALAVGLLANWVLTGLSLGRLDVTEGQIYTVSPATKQILSELKAPVQLKLYITPKDKMPTELQGLEQDVVDKLEEMRIASKGRLGVDVVPMQASNVIGRGEKKADKSQEEESVEQRMLEKGVKPYSVRALREDSVVNVLVYSSLGVAYKDKQEEIIPQVTPSNLNQLEYEIVNRVYKMDRDRMPVVALVAPRETVKIPPHIRQLYQQMGRPIPQQEDPYIYLERILAHEKYEVRRVDLTEESPLPPDFDTLVIVNPRDLEDRQRFEINKALVDGKSVFLAVQKYMWNYAIQGDSIDLNRQEETPRINPLLTPYGVSVSNDVLMDQNHAPLTVTDPNNPLAQLTGQGVTLNLPIQIVLNRDSMNEEVSITSRLSGMFYLWGSPLTVDRKKIEENKLKLTVLATTSDQGWTVPGSKPLTEAGFQPPAKGQGRIPVSVMLSGTFPNQYKDRPKPEWPPQPGAPQQEDLDKKPFTDYTPKPAKMILVGGTQMFRKEFLQQANLDFFLNSVDALSLGEALINVRTKKPADRSISKPSDAVRVFWKFFNFVGINLLVAVIGLTVILRRKRLREAYTAAWQKA